MVDRGRRVHRARQWLVIGRGCALADTPRGGGSPDSEFVKLLDVDPGFRPERVLTMQVELTGARYDAPDRVRSFFRDVIPRVRAVPGIDAAGSVSALPLSARILGHGHPRDARGPDRGRGAGRRPRASRPATSKRWGSGWCAAAISTRAIPSRAPLVAVIDETMADAFWPGESPIGQRLKRGLPSASNPWSPSSASSARSQRFVREPVAGPGVLAAAATGWSLRTIVVTRVRRPVASGERRPQKSSRSIQNGRSTASAPWTMFMASAARSATTGDAAAWAPRGNCPAARRRWIYGVMAHAVSQRRHEFGIRLALGANRTGLLGLVLRQGMTLAVVGCALGLAGALLLRRGSRHSLYAVDLATRSRLAACSCCSSPLLSGVLHAGAACHTRRSGDGTAVGVNLHSPQANTKLRILPDQRWCPRVSRSRLVQPQLSIERFPIQAERPRGGGLFARHGAEGADNVFALHVRQLPYKTPFAPDRGGSPRDSPEGPRHHRSCAEDEGTLDDVLELANVPGPRDV